MDQNKAHYVAATCIIFKDGRFLIAKRSKREKAFPGKWTVPGGKLEVNDYITKPKDTSSHWYNILENVVRREVLEEVGLLVADIRYLTSMVFIRPDNVPVLVISYYAEFKSGCLTLCEDLSDHAWVSLKEAKSYDLIEGIYEEMEMLDSVLKGEGQGVWRSPSLDILPKPI
ncbi:MAG: NUDIX domain-containing protein [Candidatus Woesearchaeota archaeon]